MSRSRCQLRVRDPQIFLLLPLLARPHRHAPILQTKPVDTSTLSARESKLAPRAARYFLHENRETSGMPATKVSGRTAGEGSGRTARVYVPEESHRGIVPMNHSNKDRSIVGGE